MELKLLVLFCVLAVIIHYREEKKPQKVIVYKLGKCLSKTLEFPEFLLP